MDLYLTKEESKNLLEAISFSVKCLKNNLLFSETEKQIKEVKNKIKILNNIKKQIKDKSERTD